MILPIPTLDHVVVNARDGLDAVAETYRDLGFTLTPRGRHTLGTVNHLAVFGTDYLELIGAPPDRPDLAPMQHPAGLHALVFGTEDADVTYGRLCEAGVAVQPPLAFSRPVEGGEAAFRTVHLDGFPGGRGYFCQHLTQHLVWCDEVRRHPNGVVGVDGLTIAARDPDAVAALFVGMFGETALDRTSAGHRLACGLTRIDIEPIEDASGGRDAWMPVLRLRTASMLRTIRALHHLRDTTYVRGRDGVLIVPAGAACGVALKFVE